MKPGHFQLEGRVGDVEVAGNALVHFAQDLLGVAVGEAFVVEDDVCGKDGQPGGDGGGVQVVDFDYVVDLAEVLAHFF